MNIYDKALRVIYTCKTTEQLNNATSYVKLAIKNYPSKFNIKHISSFEAARLTQLYRINSEYNGAINRIYPIK